jgi:Domain of unknown function (DUF1906)
LPTGIDVAGDVTEQLPQLKAAGISFVFRYLATFTHIKGKILTLAEAQAISRAGLKIGTVWENGEPTTAEYFTADQGKDDAIAALQVASSRGQPKATPIYFAVDCDLSFDAISTRLFNYFVGLRNGMAESYQIGVYGSGLVCEKMTDWALASYSWVAGAKDWAGYDDFLSRATIVQGPLPKALLGIGLPESDSDGDIATTDDYGGFQVSVPTTA